MSIDPRLMERRRTVAEDHAKRNVSRLLKFLVLVVAAGATVWLAFSPWLSVRQVATSGVAASSSHSVLADNGVRAGTPMILISASDVEARLVEDPWVAEAMVRLDWPNTVLVDVVERVPTAWVRTDGGWARRAVDGVALPSGPEPDDAMAWIEMPAVVDEEVAGSADLLGALEFVEALATDLHQGTVISVVDDELWATVSGHEVRLGRPVEMAEKARSLDALLGENLPDGSTLVLIAPTNPAVMTANQSAEDPEDSDETGAAEAGDGEDGALEVTDDDS